jgi:YbbR domain-containing protein
MDKWLRNQKVVGIISLALGILLWNVVHLAEQQSNPAPISTNASTSDEIENVSIDTINLNESKYVLLNVEPSNVRIRVRGSSSAIKKINANSKVQLNLSNVKSGDQAVKLTAVGFPSGLSVEIIPSSVIVRIEEKMKKEMEVEISLKGKPRQGYVAGTPIVQPNRVFVTIPESKMDSVQSIKGEVDVTDGTGTISKQIKLIAYDENGAKVDVAIEPSVVNVDVPITEPSKKVTLQVQLVGTPAEGYSLVGTEQDPQEITIYGKQELLDQLEFYDGLQINVSEFNTNQVISLDIPLLPGVSRVEPNKVEVHLNIVPSAKKSFEQMKVVVTGLGEQNSAEFIDPVNGTIDVTVEGAPQVVEGINADNIDAIIDVTNLPVGKHEVPIVYSTPSFVKIAKGVTTMVTVDIKEVVEVESVE